MKTDSVYQKLVSIYIFLTLFIFLFINNVGTTGLPISTFYIDGLFSYVHLFITVLFFIFYSIRYKFHWKMDYISILLLLKCLIDFVSFAFNLTTLTDNFLGYYLNSIIIFFVYLFITQKSYDTKVIDPIFYCFIIVIMLQILHTVLLIEPNFNDPIYKSYMNIPFSPSNLLGSILLPFIFVPIFKNKNKCLYIIVSLLLFLALLATKSRGALLLFVVVLILYTFIFLHFKKNNVVIKTSLFLILILTFIILLSNDTVINFFEGYTSNNNLNFNTFTSGRLNIWCNDLLYSFEKPLFGHGLGSYNVTKTGSHNILIDYMYKTGIIGTFLYFSALFLVFKNKNRSFYYFFCIIFFLNSLFEVNYMNYKCDVIFWIMCGLSTINYRNKRSKL